MFNRIQRIFHLYTSNLKAFQPNARFYLLSQVIIGASLGVYRLLFNFYILSQGHNEAALGTMITASSLTALICALPMGYLADRLGRKRSLLFGNLAISFAVLLIAGIRSLPMFFAMNILIGAGQSLAGVTMGPFLMENSSPKERTYLFSFSSGFQTGSAFLGNWIGGYLPTWFALTLGFQPTDTNAYGWSLIAIAVVSILGAIPLMFLKAHSSNGLQRSSFAPLSFFKQRPALLGKLVLPMLVTSIGAGLIMPFMNVFFRQVHHQPDSVIGVMFAWGSLAMGIGLMLAPPMAERWGKIQLVVITQALSIPFLFMLGFAPWFSISALAYYFRLALMNMSSPVYQTFVMEHVEDKVRATVASLVNMASNFGWAFSPSISGWIQVRYGFQPAFGLTIALYCLSIFFYWRFFWNDGKKSSSRSQQPHLTKAVEG